MASGGNPEYVFEDSIKKRKRIDDLIYFFNDNPEYSLDDLDGILQNDIEITFSFPINYNYDKIIAKILDDYQYKSENVINHLKTNISKYLSIERPDSVLKIYSDFKEYCNEEE